MILRCFVLRGVVYPVYCIPMYTCIPVYLKRCQTAAVYLYTSRTRAYLREGDVYLVYSLYTCILCCIHSLTRTQVVRT